jgi:hypothetical protein
VSLEGRDEMELVYIEEQFQNELSRNSLNFSAWNIKKPPHYSAECFNPDMPNLNAIVKSD